MHRNHIQSILRHWCGRQEDSGPESAFRFQSYAGPNRIPLSAEYPKPKPTEGTGTHTAKDKGKERDTAKDKGKERDTDKDKRKGRDTSQLKDLLPISRNFTPNPDGTDGAQDEWVRIDMRLMMMLRDMGYEVRGPMNGPNEGLPQYEVPKSWLQSLGSALTPTPIPRLQSLGLAPTPAPTPSHLPTGDRAYPLARPRPTVIDPALLEPMITNAVAGPSTPSHLPSGDRTYPRPRPIPSRPSERSNTVILNTANLEPVNTNAVVGPSDPVLDAGISESGGLGLPSSQQAESGLAVANQTPTIDTTRSITQESATHLGGNIVQTGTVLAQAEPGSGPNKSPAINQLVPLPPRRPQTRSTKKRKVMSTDDLALQEAKELLKGGTTRRTRTRTRRRG